MDLIAPVLMCDMLVDRSQLSGDAAIRAELIAKGVVRARGQKAEASRRIASGLAVVCRRAGSAYDHYRMLVRAFKSEMELLGDSAIVSHGTNAANALRLRFALSIKSAVSLVLAKLIDFGARRGALPNQKSLGFFSFLKVNGRNAP